CQLIVNREKGIVHTPITMNIMDTTGVTSGISECVNLFQWARSAISSKWRGTQEQRFQNELFHWQSGLQRLGDTLPAMYSLINQAEWKSHKDGVAKLLPKLQDAVYDVEDLFDDLRWYNHKVIIEGNTSQSSFIDFFNSSIRDSFIIMNDIHGRLNNISTLLGSMGLGEVTPRFDKIVRPETSSFPDETKIFGRDMELEKILGLIGAPTHNSTHSKRKRETGAGDASRRILVRNKLSNESRLPDLPVLPIVGIGGVGKTTLAQHISSHPRVKSHFDTIIWICVSGDFDVKRLTKEAIESYPGKESTIDNLNSLQHALANKLKNKKFLIVLDDMWDDALKENGQCWKRFCAPLKNVLLGSMMLVTTRSPMVANLVRSMEPIILEGLKDDVFWDFFKLCVFGSKSSNDFPELELIGKDILPKLKGSPLAAKTLGHMLQDDLRTSHWNSILENELWELDQRTTEILPALRLSYIYLPFHLKRCFSFCAVYPKDTKFEKDCLAEIWAAEGFVKRQGGIPIQDIGCQYFNDLLNRSFFQEIQGKYLIHDLLHDMAQKVSEDDCFIVKRKDDFKRIPQNVRHLSVLSSTDIAYSNLLRLGQYKKLRTLLCYKSLANKKTPASLMEDWCSKLTRMRVIVCASMNELPASIGKLKHLQYLEISRACSITGLPATICQLHNLQVLCFKRCKLESLPSDFSMLVNLWRFESQGFKYGPNIGRSQKEEPYYGVNLDADNDERGLGCRLIKNMKQLRGHLEISNIDRLNKDHSEEAELKNKEYLDKLTLQWCFSECKMLHLKYFIDTSIRAEWEMEVLPDLQPPTGIKSLVLDFYPGLSPPRWFQPQNLPSLTSVSFLHCGGLEIAAELVDINNASIGFSFLTDLIINGCPRLSSLEELLHPAYLPVIKKIAIMHCRNLISVPTERFGDFRCLEIFRVLDCGKINSQSLTAPSLKKLVLGKNTFGWDESHGNLTDNIQCSSLTYFFLSSSHLTSIQLQMWNLPALQELSISYCRSLTSIGQPGQVFTRGNGSARVLSSLTSLTIRWCEELSTIDGLLEEKYLPSIESITIANCGSLSIQGKKFGVFSSLKDLKVSGCPRIKWGGIVLPSSLQSLHLSGCEDVSSFIPSCLENLQSLVSLKISECPHLRSIPGHLWSSTLSSLQELEIMFCPDLVSIGGAEDISELKNVLIGSCKKLKGIEQSVRRGSFLASKKQEQRVKTSSNSVWCMPTRDWGWR
ncbi:putative disease resistance protein RGA3, partial [Triticum aestivum]